MRKLKHHLLLLVDGDEKGIRREKTPALSVQSSRLPSERNVMLKELREQLVKAKNQMQQQANKHRRDIQFEVEDMVYRKIQPYKLKN